ncbi:NUDIX hydrolase [Paucibacter sp. M5-1]|uniref:NUDIX hydrolase n=1 Tax=Paucibacter sp. M5-1 TaxID=3015998 RepID=UPI003F814C79
MSQIDERRAYLLLQRVAMPQLALPAFWQGVTGALESGESFEEAAVREVREETSFLIEQVFSAGYTHYFPIRPEWRSSYGPDPVQVEERVFYAFVPGGSLPRLSAEHQAFKWCLAEEAISLLEFGQNRECLSAVEETLSSATVGHSPSIERQVWGAESKQA